METIKGLTYKFDRNKHQSHAIHNAKQELYNDYHMGHTDNPQYLDTFKNKVSVKCYGRSIGTDPVLANAELKVIKKNILPNRSGEAASGRSHKSKIPRSDDAMCI